jgi:hypothetical protein
MSALRRSCASADLSLIMKRETDDTLPDAPPLYPNVGTLNKNNWAGSFDLDNDGTSTTATTNPRGSASNADDDDDKSSFCGTATGSQMGDDDDGCDDEVDPADLITPVYLNSLEFMKVANCGTCGARASAFEPHCVSFACFFECYCSRISAAGTPPAADMVFSTVGFLNLTSYSVIVTAVFKNRTTRVETLLLDLIREAAIHSTR